MKLIRRRRSPTPAQKALGIARLALRGLIAQRVARRAFKGYKLARKLPLLLAGGALAAFIAKRATGGKQEAAAPSPPAPAPSPAPSTSSSAGASAPAAAAPAPPPTEASAEPPAGAATADGAPDPEPATPPTEAADIIATEATVPAHPASAGTGGAEGDGVPTDEESAAESGESTDAAPPKS